MNRGTYRLLALGIVPIVAVRVIGTAGARQGGLTVDLKVAQSEFLRRRTCSSPSPSRTGQAAARISKWLTPADGVDESLFTSRGTAAGHALERRPSGRRHRQRLPPARARRQRQQRRRPRRPLRLHEDRPLRDRLQRRGLRSLRQEGHSPRRRTCSRHDQLCRRARRQGQAASPQPPGTGQALTHARPHSSWR